MLHMVSLVRLLLLALAGLLLGPGSAGPSFAQDYTVGPRDVVSITVWGQADLSKDFPVDQDGSISFPLVGRVKAAGLTTGRLAARLTELLEKDYLVNPQVSVTVKEYLSQKVQVLGEAGKARALLLDRAYQRSRDPVQGGGPQQDRRQAARARPPPAR